ncbi:hypothetical protein [Senegalia massiliensis]|uniref:Uncharacterized protein n=1 Tax=Senegalia massiliensis TaxID=1720316 RepID=A0A845QVJ0_9CLOT|nr:hypothetical protein [Senegalia massiliensis]NBI05809.1 hypothetical protein [Senegalia massiliensis]
MKMSEKDIIKKKLLDAQEMVRDYESFSKNIRDTEIGETLKMFAEESGVQAKRLQAILEKMDEK